MFSILCWNRMLLWLCWIGLVGFSNVSCLKSFGSKAERFWSFVIFVCRSNRWQLNWWPCWCLWTWNCSRKCLSADGANSTFTYIYSDPTAGSNWAQPITSTHFGKHANLGLAYLINRFGFQIVAILLPPRPCWCPEVLSLEQVFVLIRVTLCWSSCRKIHCHL